MEQIVTMAQNIANDAGETSGGFKLIPDISGLLETLFMLLVIFMATIIVRRMLIRLIERPGIDATLRGFLEAAIKAVVWFIALIAAADYLGIPMSGLVTALGVAGLALSLSLQGLLTNLFSGMTILVTRPFASGDTVTLGAHYGEIHRVGLTHTEIRTPDYKLIFIPNGQIVSAAITNYSREERRRVELRVLAGYEHSIETVRATLLETAGRDSRVLETPTPVVRIGEYGERGIEYRLRVWCETKDYWSLYYALGEASHDALLEKGIGTPFSRIDISIVSDSD